MRPSIAKIYVLTAENISLGKDPQIYRLKVTVVEQDSANLTIKPVSSAACFEQSSSSWPGCGAPREPAELFSEWCVKQELDVSPALAEMMDHAVCCVADANKEQLVRFASDEFSSFTGYPMKEIIGKNCRFLQGRNTTEAQRESARKLVREEEPGCITITNYTRRGVEFACTLYLCPLYCKNTGQLKFFLGSQTGAESRDSKSGFASPNHTANS